MRTNEHTFLVAFTVEESDRGVAEHTLHDLLNLVRFPESPVTSWWVAEDDRHDGSDNRSAVFVPYGMTQDEASRLLDPEERD